MLAGPIFSRDVLTSPRQGRHFVLRAGYVLALFVLMYTASQATFGWQQVSSLGETARFGSLVFQLFSVVQLALVLFFAPLFAASRVSQEKDRQTLVLLLMTDLSDRELVFGKLLATSLRGFFAVTLRMIEVTTRCFNSRVVGPLISSGLDHVGCFFCHHQDAGIDMRADKVRHG